MYRVARSARFDLEKLRIIAGTPWQTKPVREADPQELPEFKIAPQDERRREGDHADQVGAQIRTEKSDDDKGSNGEVLIHATVRRLYGYVGGTGTTTGRTQNHFHRGPRIARAITT